MESKIAKLIYLNSQPVAVLHAEEAPAGCYAVHGWHLGLLLRSAHGGKKMRAAGYAFISPIHRPSHTRMNQDRYPWLNSAATHR